MDGQDRYEEGLREGWEIARTVIRVLEKDPEITHKDLAAEGIKGHGRQIILNNSVNAVRKAVGEIRARREIAIPGAIIKTKDPVSRTGVIINRSGKKAMVLFPATGSGEMVPIGAMEPTGEKVDLTKLLSLKNGADSTDGNEEATEEDSGKSDVPAAPLVNGAKPVRCVETGETWPTKAAAREHFECGRMKLSNAVDLGEEIRPGMHLVSQE